MYMEHYKKYVGQFVKRFYAPFVKEHIFSIKDHKVSDNGIHLFLYSDGQDDWWADCEDSCIITNEIPILDIDWVANVNDPRYNGYNPFSGDIIKDIIGK